MTRARLQRGGTMLPTAYAHVYSLFTQLGRFGNTVAMEPNSSLLLL